MQYFTQVGLQLIDSGHERLEAQERTVEGCAGSGRRICCAVADFFRYCWQPIVVATVISRNIWKGSYHFIHPAITRVLRAFGKRLAWKISQKEDPNWAQIFWGATNCRGATWRLWGGDNVAKLPGFRSYQPQPQGLLPLDTLDNL